jgi:hypothetical protein
MSWGYIDSGYAAGSGGETLTDVVNAPVQASKPLRSSHETRATCGTVADERQRP